MKKQLRWSLTIITLLSLTGCGLKGPLYFPPAEASATQPPVNNVDRAQPKNISNNTPADAQK
nr:lipoprotein [Xenorhabdus beddingii]